MPLSTISLLPILVMLSPILVLAHGDGMDMSMDGAMSLTAGQMIPWLHFAVGGDTVWFLGWVPTTKGAIVGTCVGLFLLAIVDRWLASIRATAENYWRRKAQIVMTNELNSSPVGRAAKLSALSRVIPRHVPPFILAHDVTRGILHAGQVGLGFAFMLVVMTYQAAFIISIIIGLGVGETIFGRYIGAVSAH